MMEKIFIPLGNGQSIMPEVMHGILMQSVKCAIVPITSEKTNNIKDCSGNLNNWIDILKLVNKRSFIGMDSDVVMVDSKTIETLLDAPNDVDFAAIITKEEQQKISQTNKIMVHSLFYCKIPERMLTWFKIFQKDGYKGCCWCEAINALTLKKRKYRVFTKLKAVECERVEI